MQHLDGTYTGTNKYSDENVRVRWSVDNWFEVPEPVPVDIALDDEDERDI